MSMSALECFMDNLKMVLSRPNKPFELVPISLTPEGWRELQDTLKKLLREKK